MKSIPLFVFLPAIFSLCWSQTQAESASSHGADVASLENEQPHVYTIELGHNDTMDVLERRILQLIEDENDFYYYNLKVGDTIIDLSSNGCEHFLVLPYLRSLGTVSPDEKREFSPCHYLETKCIKNEKIACFRFKVDYNNIEEVQKPFYDILNELEYDKLALRIIVSSEIKMVDFIKFYHSITSLSKPIAGICLEVSSPDRTPAPDAFYLPANVVSMFMDDETSDIENKDGAETTPTHRECDEK